MSEPVFKEVRVADAPVVEFCLDQRSGDPVAAWLLDHGAIDEPVQRAFLGLVEPGCHAIDLGSHLGTFSLPAAALGAAVIAVDANRRQVELLRAAAVRNGFASLHALHAAISPSRTPVRFLERNIHGCVALEGESEAATAVAGASVDGLLAELGWSDVDVIKMDIEGTELTALDGMRELFGRGQRPAFVFECNGSMLPRYGGSTEALRERFEQLGYLLFMIDHLRPGILVESNSRAAQPECASDYVAVADRGQLEGSGWRILPPFPRRTVVSRLGCQAASSTPGYRWYAATTIATGPEWLRIDPKAAKIMRRLSGDSDPLVRHAAHTQAGPVAAGSKRGPARLGMQRGLSAARHAVARLRLAARSRSAAAGWAARRRRDPPAEKQPR